MNASLNTTPVQPALSLEELRRARLEALLTPHTANAQPNASNRAAVVPGIQSHQSWNRR